MAFSKVILVACLLACIALVNSADEKRKCYVCDSCKDNGESKECANGEKMCFHHRTEKDAETYKRGCTADKNYCTESLKDQGCSVCEKDECNSATSVASSVALSAVAALVLKAFY